jgi:hypothetical protein
MGDDQTVFDVTVVSNVECKRKTRVDNGERRKEMQIANRKRNPETRSISRRMKDEHAGRDEVRRLKVRDGESQEIRCKGEETNLETDG